MQNYISLKEAVRRKIVKVGDYVEYNPKYGKYIPPQCLTGLRYNPVFRTEKLGWKLEKINGRFCLISDNGTEQELCLEGETGFLGGTVALDNIAKKCYTDSEMAYKVQSINEEMFNKISHNSKKTKRHISYWLASQRLCPSSYFSDFHMRFVYSEGYICDYSLCCSCCDGVSNRGSMSVRIVVFLKSNIGLELSEKSDGSERNPWRFSKIDEEMLKTYCEKENLLTQFKSLLRKIL